MSCITVGDCIAKGKRPIMQGRRLMCADFPAVGFLSPAPTGQAGRLLLATGTSPRQTHDDRELPEIAVVAERSRRSRGDRLSVRGFFLADWKLLLEVVLVP